MIIVIVFLILLHLIIVIPYFFTFNETVCITHTRRAKKIVRGICYLKIQFSKRSTKE